MIESGAIKVTFSGDGKTTAFPYSFAVNSAADIHVAIHDSSTGDTVELSSDFYVDTSAKMVHYPGYAPGQEPAMAERPAIIPNGYTITIFRQTHVNQLTDLGSRYPLRDIEMMVDKLTMIAQEHDEQIGRSVHTDISGTETADELMNRIETASNIQSILESGTYSTSIAQLALEESTGYGVVNGYSATVSGGIITIGSGTAHLISGYRYSNASTAFTPIADPTNPRYDLIYLSSAGIVSISTGVAAKSPVLPSLPSGGLALWASLITAAGDISLTDARIFKPRFQNMNVVNVKDLGAAGDGTTDDTTVFQYAIDYARSIGGTVFIPSGTYLLSKSLQVTTYPNEGNTAPRIIGESRQYTVLKCSITDGSPLFKLTGASGYFSNAGGGSFTIVASSWSTSTSNSTNATAFYIDGQCFSTWDNVTINGMGVAIHLINEHSGAFTELNSFKRFEIEYCYRALKIEKGTNGYPSFHGNIFDLFINYNALQTAIYLGSGTVYNCDFTINAWCPDSSCFMYIGSDEASIFNRFNMRIEFGSTVAGNAPYISGSGYLWGFGHFGRFNNSSNRIDILDRTTPANTDKQTFVCSDYATGVTKIIPPAYDPQGLIAYTLQSPYDTLFIGTKGVGAGMITSGRAHLNHGYSYSGSIAPSGSAQTITLCTLSNLTQLMFALASFTLDSSAVAYFERKLYAINGGTNNGNGNISLLATGASYAEGNETVSFSLAVNSGKQVILTITTNVALTWTFKVDGIADPI